MESLSSPTIQVNITKPDYVIDASKPFGLLDTHPNFHYWHIFGVRAKGQLVDINDGIDNIMVGVLRHKAEWIVTARNDFVNEVMRILK